MEDQNNKPNNLYDLIVSRYLPYWPLFVILLVVFIAGAWGYLYYATPVYEAKASLIIKDEKKGVDDSKIMESMNAFDTKKIVENEIEVIHSRKLMQKVVRKLNLYAPVSEAGELKNIFEGGEIKNSSAYTSSPVLVELKHPEKIVIPPNKKPTKYFFDFNAKRNQVQSDGKAYPLNQWVKFKNIGEVKFLQNPNQFGTLGDQLYFSLEEPKVVTLDLLNNLDVSSSNKLSTVIELTYKDPVPKRGEKILNSLIEAYNKSIIDQKNVLADNTLKFIEDRMVKVENDLGNLENQIQEYKTNESAVDLSEQGRIYLQNASQNDRKIADIKLQLSVLEQVKKYVVSQSQTGGLVPSTLGLKDPVLSQLLNNLYNSEMTYERLKRTTATNNPALASVKNEIDKMKPDILENIQSQKQSLQASLNSLYSSSGKYNSIIKSIPKKEQQLVEVNRRKAIKDKLFTYLLQKREETALAYAPAGESRLVDRAQSSLNPVSPKKIVVYLLALILAMGTGVVYVMRKEILNTKILFRSQLENLSAMPILGELSFVKTRKKNLLATDEQAFPLIEEMRQLAARLGLYTRRFKKKKILITSSIAGEGKSFVSANLAHCLAQAGKKTVLLDMDFRNPYTTKFFNLRDNKGVIDFLEGKVQIENILNNLPDNHNLFFAPAGTKGGDYTKLLLNGKLEELFEYLDQDFEYIIIDSGPINLVSDVNLLAEYSDKTLMVIRHGHTPKQMIKRLDHSIKSNTLSNVSIVFNGVKNRGMVKNNYGYGYGFWYGYEGKYAIPPSE